MGCDIHMGVEVRDGGIWRLCQSDLCPERGAYKFNQYTGRHYCLFGALAEGVRRDVPSVAPARGVPSDSSEDYKRYVESWEGDGHSHSWCTVAECLVFSEWPEDQEWAELIASAADLGAPEDVRFVYFFDN